ncbi:MAG: recombination mediator RecR [bacterium]|nr:recombination mediator RecR [bacterium]
MNYPAPIHDLIEQFRRFPGVGPKSAERFVFHLLRNGTDGLDALVQGLGHLRNRIDRCTMCGMFAEATTCAICANPRRSHDLLCVVAEPADLIAVERTGEFKGVYHILGGLLAPIEGIGPEQLRIPELVERVRGEKTKNFSPSHREGEREGVGQQGIAEVIFAFDPTIEGETTVNYLARQLAGSGVRLTRIARGLPVGGDLEYADPITLGDSFTGRRELPVTATMPILERVARTRSS